MRKPLVALLGAVALAASMAVASPVFAQDLPPADPFSIPVAEHVLPNGLKILVVENSSVQTASCRLFYRVGSANERPGTTGIAHFLEHLMFKGTDAIGVKDAAADRRIRAEIARIDARMHALRRQRTRTAAEQQELANLQAELLQQMAAHRAVTDTEEIWHIYQGAGGTGMNAATSRDWTQYQITLPANKVELFMWLEADRMQNAVFREFEAEKAVVREERRLSENRPASAFGEAFNQAMFGAHPYAWPVLGWHEDIENISLADVQDFYDRYYVPDNAVMVVVGNVKAGEVFALAEKYFGTIPRGKLDRPHIPVVAQPAVGERRIVGQDDTQPHVQISYARGAGSDGREAAYQVLASILSGDSGRLEMALVRGSRVATSAGASTLPGRYASTFDISAEARGDTTPTALLAAIDAELDKLGREPVPGHELQAAKNRMRQQLLMFLKSDEILGIVLGVYEVTAGWKALNGLFAAIDEVTAEDVQILAQQVFRPENRCVGLLNRGTPPVRPTPPAPLMANASANANPAPATESPAESIPAHPRDLAFAERTFAPPTPEQFRVELPNGLVVYVLADKRFPTVTATAHIKAGGLWEPAAQTGLANAMGDLMKRGGIADLDGDELNAHLDFLGARLATSMGRTRGNVSITGFDADTTAILRLFADVLRHPAFRADALSRWQDEQKQAISRRFESPSAIYAREFFLRVYGAESPVARQTSEASIAAITPDALREFHRQFVTPHNTIISITGNFDRATVTATLLELFGDWTADAPQTPAITEAPALPASRKIHVYPKDSSQGYVMLGHATVRRPHADYLALQVMNAVLRARIFNRVRRDEGLAYSAGSRFDAGEEFAGVIGAAFQSRCEAVPFALKLTLAEMQKMRDDLVPADELATVKQGMIDGFPGMFNSSEAIVGLFAEHELAGRPADYFANWRERVAAITPEIIREVARRHMHPEKMTVVVVGRPNEMLMGDAKTGVMLIELGDVELHTVGDEPGIAGAAGPRGPEQVIEAALAALKEGDVEKFLKFCSKATRDMYEQDENVQQMLQFQAQVLKTMEYTIDDIDITGDRASVGLDVTIDFQGQKINRTQRLELVKEDGEWRLDYNVR